MKNIAPFLVSSLVVLASLVAGCASTGSADADAARTQAIQAACLVDAGIRPTVTVLLAVPSLATPQEIAAVAVARAAIDPICANPSAPVQATTIQAFTAATGQVAQIAVSLQQRQAANTAK